MGQVNIDCLAIQSKAQLHQALSQALQFPQWYGNNLDALMDCLTEIGRDTTLVLEHFDPTALWAKGLADTLQCACRENPFLKVIFA